MVVQNRELSRSINTSACVLGYQPALRCRRDRQRKFGCQLKATAATAKLKQLNATHTCGADATDTGSLKREALSRPTRVALSINCRTLESVDSG